MISTRRLKHNENRVTKQLTVGTCTPFSLAVIAAVKDKKCNLSNRSSSVMTCGIVLNPTILFHASGISFPNLSKSSFVRAEDKLTRATILLDAAGLVGLPPTKQSPCGSAGTKRTLTNNVGVLK